MHRLFYLISQALFVSSTISVISSQRRAVVANYQLTRQNLVCLASGMTNVANNAAARRESAGDAKRKNKSEEFLECFRTLEGSPVLSYTLSSLYGTLAISYSLITSKHHSLTVHARNDGGCYKSLS